jgi:hypothetical protein
MADDLDSHFTLWTIGSQQLHVSRDGGRIVTDAGLLAVRALEKPRGVIAELAHRLPDPRSPKSCRTKHCWRRCLVAASEPLAGS